MMWAWALGWLKSAVPSLAFPVNSQLTVPQQNNTSNFLRLAVSWAVNPCFASVAGKPKGAR